MRASWRCRHGWHTWYLVSMRNQQIIEVAPHWSWICTLVERCGRCGVERTKFRASIPKRPRILEVRR